MFTTQKTSAIFAAALMMVGSTASAAPLVVSTPDAAETPDSWGACPWHDPERDGDTAEQCRTVSVPQDHNAPDADPVDLIVGRVPAGSPEDKVGVLVVNYGPVGSSSARDAARMSGLIPQEITDKFDLIAISSRATVDDSQCFTSRKHQEDLLQAITTRPETSGQRANSLVSAKEYADACAKNLSASKQQLSSATFAADLDLVRKALGENTLNMYASEGHGYAAQLYANMFPKHVRAVVVDGVRDGQRVAGVGRFAGHTVAERSGAIAARQQAFMGLIAACDAAGPKNCLLAEPHPDFPTAESKVMKVIQKANDDAIYNDLLFRFINQNGKVFLEENWKIGTNIESLADILYATNNPETQDAAMIDTALYALWKSALGDGPTTIDMPDFTGIPGVFQRIESLFDRQSRKVELARTPTGYRRDAEALLVAECNDSRHLPNIHRAADQADAAKKHSITFGREMAWRTVPCSAWPGASQAKQSTFDARTDAPLLFVTAKNSIHHDYALAKQAVSRYPNAKLVTNEGWSEASYGMSDCLNQAVTSYLLDPQTAKDATCQAPVQPFDRPLPAPDVTAVAGTTGFAQPENTQEMLDNMPEVIAGDKGLPYLHQKRRQQS